MDSKQDSLIRKIERGKFYCMACGYDLTGLRSATCPECGNPIDFESCESVDRAPESFAARKTALFHWLWDHDWIIYFAGIGVIAILIWVFR